MPWERGRSAGLRVAAVGARPVSWALYGCREGVASPHGLVWPPWGRGRSPRPRMAAVGAWTVPWALYGRRGGVAVPWAPYGVREGVAGPLDPIWLPWGRGRSPGPHMAAVVAWTVSWASYGRVGAWTGP